jgi:hypothetical protein
LHRSAIALYLAIPCIGVGAIATQLSIPYWTGLLLIGVLGCYTLAMQFFLAKPWLAAES